MRRELGAIIIGVGVEFIFLILSVQVKDMPMTVAVTGYTVGALLILYGIVCIFVPVTKIWEGFMSIRLRSPVFLKKKDTVLNREEIISQPTVTTLLERKYADWMTTALNQDNNNLPSCLEVTEPRVNFAPLCETDSYFIITYVIRSSSIYTLDIGKTIEGHLRYKSEPMEKIPEVLNHIEHLERSSTKQLKLRQWVSQTRMNQVVLDGGSEIYLLFSDVNIWVEARFPDGSSGPKFRLPIQDKLKLRMPTQVELESQ